MKKNPHHLGNRCSSELLSQFAVQFPPKKVGESRGECVCFCSYSGLQNGKEDKCGGDGHSYFNQCVSVDKKRGAYMTSQVLVAL